MAILFSILLYGKRGWVVAAVGAFGWGALAVVSFIDRNRLIPWSTEHWFLDGAMFGPLVFVGLAFITDSRYSSALRSPSSDAPSSLPSGRCSVLAGRRSAQTVHDLRLRAVDPEAELLAVAAQDLERTASARQAREVTRCYTVLAERWKTSAN